MIKWINGSYAHGLSFGRHRVRKLSTRICVSKGRFGCFLSLMKIVATPFHQSVPICIKQIMACKPSGAVVCALKYRLQSNEKNHPKARLQAAIIKDCRLGNIECSKYQLMFVTQRTFCQSHLFPG